jgi:hydroxyacylglutathione hydrolase
MPPTIERWVVGPLQTNTYLVGDPITREAAVIDPAVPDLVDLERWVRQGGWRVRWLLLTHGHFDHLEGADWARGVWPVPLAVGRGDVAWLDDPARNLSAALAAWGTAPVRVRPAQLEVEDGWQVPLGGLTLQALATPGHTPGSVCYRVEDDLFTGDTLFRDSIGRSDLPGGDANTLDRSLARLVHAVPPTARLWPGHGPPSQLERELRENPFLQGL